LKIRYFIFLTFQTDLEKIYFIIDDFDNFLVKVIGFLFHFFDMRKN